MPASSPPPSAEVRSALEVCLELPPEKRRSFLEDELSPGPDLELALEILDGVDVEDDFLESGAEPPVHLGPVPERFGAFEVERLLGWGSMGVVYEARHGGDGTRVAVKVVRVDVASEEAVARFHAEAKALGKLDHPSVARVVETGTVDLGHGQQPFIALEYVEGVSLQRHAEEHSLDQRERAALMAQVCRAVAHAHEQGVLHRDLKPENVLVNEGGRPTVLDFGVARIVASDDTRLDLTATGQIIGTLAYMAPEQARGAPFEAACDQFALGAMLHELVTGELPLPIRGLLPHEALREIADGGFRVSQLRAVMLEPDLVTILATALASEPSRRYRDVSALAEDLARYAEGLPVLARRPTAIQRSWRWLKANAVATAVATTALLVLGGLGGMTLHWRFAASHEVKVSQVFKDRGALRVLVQERSSLYPLRAATVPRIEQWIAAVEVLAGNAAEIQRLADEPRSADEAAWLPEIARGYLSQLDGVIGPDGLLTEVRRDLDAARRCASETVEGAAADWAAAAERVAADERFPDDFVLTPQEGLFPIGPDPVSGLEEFAVHNTGAVPRRESPTDSVVAVEGDAIVLVLLPGGQVSAGRRVHVNWATDQSEAAHHEGPAIDLDLEPYLLGKFELTQDQWIRCCGENPSDWEIGSIVWEVTVTALNPVESNSYQLTVERLGRLGLTLPTEARWEAAARAGKGEVFPNPENRAEWHRRANCLSRILGEQGEQPDEADGYRVHAPVGTFAPNDYGLHDLIGNVSELCIDDYKVHYHEMGHRPGDQRVVVKAPDGDISIRGGSFEMPPRIEAIAYRGTNLVDQGRSSTGARVALDLQQGVTR